jgi:hypothetical protein
MSRRAIHRSREALATVSRLLRIARNVRDEHSYRKEASRALS